MLPLVLLHRLLYLPIPLHTQTPAAAGLTYEDVFEVTDDGVSLHGWYVPHPDPLATFYFLHGNAGNVSHRVEMLHALHRVGLSVFILDYRGYGKSKGRPSEAGTYTDALAGWRWLRDHAEGAAPLIIYGRSLGGAVGVWLALQEEVDAAGILLENTFTTLRDAAADSVPLPGVRTLVPDLYPTIERIGALSIPLLLVHGDRDDVVAVEHVHRLYAAASEPKEQYLVPGAGHNDTILVGGAAYIERMHQLIDACKAGL